MSGKVKYELNGKRVRFLHLFDRKNPQVGGTTLAYVEVHGYTYFSAYDHPSQYCKERGREASFGRLAKGNKVMPVMPSPEWPRVEKKVLNSYFVWRSGRA